MAQLSVTVPLQSDTRVIVSLRLFSFMEIGRCSGIEFKLGQKVTGTSEGANGKLALTYEAVKDGTPGEISADVVLVATGRRPVTGTPLAR
jgi:pyruvate/2-oxoglutarate dehydrogenase complex dihydrolipoamide dehydrogenase (E3) component